MTEPSSPAPDATPPATVLTRIRKHLPRVETPSDAERTWALVAHFGGAAGMFLTVGVGGWIAPLILLLARGNHSATVRTHVVNALNFQLVWSGIGALVWLLVWRPPLILPLVAVTLVGVAFGVLGGLRANEGRPYTYPLSVPLVK